jgi:hypothetical protein
MSAAVTIKTDRRKLFWRHRMKIHGNKSIIGSIAAGLLTVLYSLDLMVNDLPDTPAMETGWLSPKLYLILAGLIGSFTGVSFRLGMKK